MILSIDIIMKHIIKILTGFFSKRFFLYNKLKIKLAFFLLSFLIAVFTECFCGIVKIHIWSLSLVSGKAPKTLGFP